MVVPGRAFLQRLYGLTCGVAQSHYRVRLTKATKADLLVWLTFLENHNGVTLYMEEMFLSEVVVKIYTDASTSKGCGGVFENKWFSLE